MAAKMYARIFMTVFMTVSAWAQIPADYALNLVAMTPWTGTNIYIGQVVKMQLTIDFASGTSSGTQVEILTSVTPTCFALLGLDQAIYTVGDNLQGLNSDWLSAAVIHPGIDQTPNTGIVYNTRAVLSLGDVYNTEGSSTTSASQIVMNYEMVYVSQCGQSDSSQVYTSAGMEYSGGSRIYVIQMPFNLYGAQMTGSPAFNLDVGPIVSVPNMEHVNATLTLTLPYSSNDVTVSVGMTSGEVDDLYVPEIKTRSVGAAFDEYVYPQYISSQMYYTCPLSASHDLYMGTLVNSDSQRQTTTPASWDVVVDITFVSEKRTIYGKNVTAAIGVSLNADEIHVAELTFVPETPASPPTAPVSFTLDAPIVQTVSPGFGGVTNLHMVTVPKSNIDYTITLSTASLTASPNALSILAVNPVSYGVNHVCEIHASNIDFSATSSVGSSLMDSATVTFNASNFGFQTVADANKISFQVAVIMMPDAVEAETHQLTVEINDLPPQTATFTVGPPQPYDDPVDMSFVLANKCPSDEFQSGTVVPFSLTVTTERSKTPGPMTIEFPIPDNLTDSPLAFHSATLVEKGLNTVCVQLGLLDVVLSNWSSVAGGNDRGVLTLPLVCNFEIDTATWPTVEDKFVIDVKVTIKDSPTILEATELTTLEMGIGVNYSNSQLWVATDTIQVAAPTDLNSPYRINGVTILSNYMPVIFPDDILLQWSADNSVYHITPFDWETPIVNTGSYTINLVRPVIARYVRLINTQGNCMKDHVYESTMTDRPSMYGPANLSDQLLQNIMLALDDGNLETCFTLPPRGATSTAPFVWLEAKKNVFGLDETKAFNVEVTGEGIQCHNRNGPQITYLTHPKEASAASFQGNKVICTHTGNATVLTTKTTCSYSCTCTGQEQCEKLSLLMLNADPGTTYTLCDITVTDV